MSHVRKNIKIGNIKVNKKRKPDGEMASAVKVENGKNARTAFLAFPRQDVA